jgi:LuxR family transcriptional regulator, maltose regulon positive regulatory protein
MVSFGALSTRRSTVELVRTKLDPPLALSDVIARSRLLPKLDEGRTRVTLLQAPAGYGKTTLMSQWFRSLRAARADVAWLSVDGADGSAEALLEYVAAAVATAMPASLGLSAAGGIAPLVNALQKQGNCHLFVDDVHLLPPDALRSLYRFIDRSPPGILFVLASRAIPDIPLARLRARGQLRELGTEELKFTAQEAQAFLAQGSKSSLSDAQLLRLLERTDGWITGIRLASGMLKNRASADEMLASLTGSRCAVADFFAEEVLAALPAHLREFLLQCSVLDRLSPSLCDAVTRRSDGRETLGHIGRSGLFLMPLDEERNWYRYHPLFAEFLERRRVDEGTDERELNARASGWFWAHDLPVEAVEHALRSGDVEHAARLLESRCLDMTYTGRLQLVCQFATRIPEHVLRRFPRMLLSVSWMLTLNLRLEEARRNLSLAAERLQELASTATSGNEELRGLDYLLQHRQMILAVAEDDAPRVEHDCRHLLEAFPEQRHPYLAGNITAQLLYSQREQYQLTELDRLAATAQGILARSSFSFASIALHASIGPSLFFAGRTDAALSALEKGLSESARFAERSSALAALPALPMSELLYECNELDRAQELIDTAMPFANEMGFVDQLLSGYITSARLKHARGDLTGAQHVLDEGMGVAMARKLERLRLAIVAERVKFLLQDGRSEQAVRFARSAGIPQSCEHMLPKRGVTTRDEWRALAWFRIAVSEGRMQEALSVGKHWRNFCAARGAIRSLIRWDLLLAQALFVSADVRAAQRSLREAIGHAASSRSIRTFLDEGSIVRTLLASTYEADLDVLHPTDAFAAELLEAFDKSTKRKPALHAMPQRSAPEGLYGRLSVKEREILALVSTGMRNREVAMKLGMTEGSVKWYMQQVYDKVGTRRRLQAVERARQFGVIA